MLDGAKVHLGRETLLVAVELNLVFNIGWSCCRREELRVGGCGDSGGVAASSGSGTNGGNVELGGRKNLVIDMFHNLFDLEQLSGTESIAECMVI